MKLATLAFAAVLVAGPALAQMQPAATTKTSTKTVAKPAAGKTTTTTKVATTKPVGANMAQHTTKTGKTITYDCSKKGNANKTACKNKK